MVVLAAPWKRGEIVGMTNDGRLIVDFGNEMDEQWIFHPQDLEYEERDDLWQMYLR